ncbi:MAG: alpha-galactosidase [Armatimonadetes bacterium]|nr:alpha-galactosidase [Armatimonadota bacterium]
MLSPYAVAASVLLMCMAASSGGFTDVALKRSPEPEVRFVSDQVVCVEANKDGRWLGRYWSADGRINMPNEVWEQDAFQIEIDKQLLQTGWKYVSGSEAAKTESGARHFVVQLTNTTRLIEVKVHTVLDGTPILTRWIEVTNKSDKPMALNSVYPWAGRLWPVRQPYGDASFVPERRYTLGYFTRDIWSNEGWFEWKELQDGSFLVKCDKGQGHDDPFFIVRNESAGEYFIGHLAWSANYNMEFQKDDTGLLFKVGPASAAALRVIAPNETIKTPEVHLGYVSGDLDHAVQSMHDHLRRFVLPKRTQGRSFLIEYLVPADQGYYTPFDETSAMKCVDIAAAIGAELFILDAYWWDITCDWVPSAKRFPRGLKPLVDYVHQKGMLFGLYAETEGGRGPIKESNIYKQHPDWFMPKEIVNLAIPEAAQWVESEICRLIEEHNLDLFRLDYNPYHTGEGLTVTRGGIEENNYWRYYDAFYSTYDRLMKKYPNVIFQQCAAGGARNDLGTVSRFHEIYLTDGLSIPHELRVYSGLTLGLPPENFVILHGADGGPGAGRSQNLDTILRMSYSVATPQIFVGMVAPSVEELSPYRRDRFLHYAKIYKEFIRPALPTCKIFHHEPVNSRGGVLSSGWFAMEYATPDKTKGWANIIRTGPADSDLYVFRPRGLDHSKTYKVTFDSRNETITIDGLQLAREGLPVWLESVGSSELLLIKER